MTTVATWKTIELVEIDGVRYAYQQRYCVGHRERNNVVIPDDDHRLVELSELCDMD